MKYHDLFLKVIDKDEAKCKSLDSLQANLEGLLAKTSSQLD